MKHTPTPWKIIKQDTGFSVDADELHGCLSSVAIGQDADNPVCLAFEMGGFETPTLDANADFIVRACNAHEDLVIVAENSDAVFNTLLSSTSLSQDMREMVERMKTNIGEALAKAEGR